MPVINFGPNVATTHVAGRPFEAEFEEVRLVKALLRKSRKRVCGAIYRDSLGRVRKDIHLDDGAHIASIADPVTGQMFALYINRRSYLIAPGLPQNVQPPGAYDYPGEPRMIEGFECFPLHLPNGIDAWFSPALYHVIMEEQRDAPDHYCWRLFHIRCEEPSPDLFTPQTFPKKVNAPSPNCVTVPPR
jgi:hypothetical protein